MKVWLQALILLCCVLNCVESSTPSPLNSFNLTKRTRTKVQLLQEKYKEQQLGGMHYDYRDRQLKDLPLLSTDFYSWLKLTDWERLHAALGDIQAYCRMLEWKRKQLEKEENKQLAGQSVRNTLPQSIKYIELDLKDLMGQVRKQMNYVRSHTKQTLPTARAPLNPETSAKTLWDSRVEGYIILRDLDLYLTKLARDFLLLASRTHMTKH